jgi:hypothetical protein
MSHQSIVSDQEKRLKLVWDVERKLAEDDAAPVIFLRSGRVLLATAGERDHDYG